MTNRETLLEAYLIEAYLAQGKPLTEAVRLVNNIRPHCIRPHCELCGSEMEDGEGKTTLGLVCDQCVENNEWGDEG